MCYKSRYDILRVNSRNDTSALDTTIELIDGVIGQFNGKDTMSYLEAYRVEMMIRDIPEDTTISHIPSGRYVEHPH